MQEVAVRFLLTLRKVVAQVLRRFFYCFVSCLVCDVSSLVKKGATAEKDFLSR